MRILISYIPVLLAATLPFLFRRSYGVRVSSAVLLCTVALMHFVYLIGMPRLVLEDGVRQFGVKSSTQLPSEYRMAVD